MSMNWIAGPLLGVCLFCLASCRQSGAPSTVSVDESRARPKARARDRDGFEGQTLAPFWRAGDHGSGRYEAGAVVLSDEQARSGKKSVKITVREGDIAQRGDLGQANERAELDSGARAMLDQGS